MCVCLSACAFGSLRVLFVCLFEWLVGRVLVCLFLCLFICLFVCLLVLCVCLVVCLFVSFVLSFFVCVFACLAFTGLVSWLVG